MALSDMQVFNQYIMPATIETLGQMVEKFNAASGNTIQLSTDGFEGDFFEQSFFAAVHSAQRRVDRYAANGAASATDLTQLKDSTVKIAGGFGPIQFEPGQMTWLRNPTARGIEVASRNFAEALLKDQLNTAIAALVAAIGNQADATWDITTAGPDGTGVVDYDALNNGHAKFGDQSGNIIAHVMSGSLYHKLIGLNLANANRLFSAGNVRVVDLLDRLVVVTDAPALTDTTPTPDSDFALGLTQGAARVNNTADVISNIETTNGLERIVTTMQVDYTFGLGLKGYTWDTTNGGKSPLDAEIATGSNWDKTATDIKHTAGVIVKGDVA